MKEGCLMRVLFCKIHCPFICLCKPSTARHLYTSGPLKLENTPHNVAVCDESDYNNKSCCEEGGVVINGKEQEQGGVNVVKSCIRKVPFGPEEVGRKKRVQWMDDSGKQLAEIKEFESSETGDTDNEEESSRCLCVIL